MPQTLATDALATSIAAKVNRRVLPLLMAAWFMAYIDRFNVSYAALQMNQALGLSAAVFGLGGGLFFLGYALFEVPSNIVLVRVGARRWLGRIMMTWGLITAATMFVQGPASFYSLRLLLGVAEAGCFPGMAYCLSRWLLPQQRAAALGVLAGVAMFSGIVAGPIAAGLLALNGVWGLQGWQWLFLAEGIPAVIVGLCLWRYLPDDPASVSWLTTEERAFLQREVGADVRSHVRANLRIVVCDRRYWSWALGFFCAAAAGSAIVLFRPVMMRQMAGLSDTATAFFSAVPSIVAAVAAVWVGRRSTRHNERRWHSAVPMLVGSVGVALAGVVYGLPGVLVVAALSSVAAAGQPPLFASVSSGATGEVNAVGIAFVNSVASVGGFVGPYVLGSMIDAGGLALACGVAAFIMVCGACVVLSVRPPREEIREANAAAVAVA
jgi:ACS family tartrate transporter-like MFS transporter